MNPITPITTTINNFCRLTDLGRSKTYELLATGALESLKIGKRRLIILDSYRRLIEQQRAGSSSTQTERSGDPSSPGVAVTAPRRRGRPRKVSE